MLKTLYQIGKEISKGRDPWEDILTEPKISDKDRENKKLLVLYINFDLDAGQVIINPDQLVEYSNSIERLREWSSLKIQGGNNKASYISADATKLEQIAKSFFGKSGAEGEYPQYGEFVEAMDKLDAQLADTPFYQFLLQMVALRESFMSYFQTGAGKLSIQAVVELLGLAKNEKIVLLCTTITSQKDGLNNTLLGATPGYDQFVQAKYFSDNSSSDKKGKTTASKLCYATGEQATDVREAEFSERYNINKFFVKTTRNFATSFDKKAYAKNYQISSEVELMLDRASSHLLNNAVIEIAGIRHVVIPEFFNQDTVSIKHLKFLNKVDLLFSFKNWEELSSYLDTYTDTDDFYWLTFAAIDSDGNYFKIGNLIKDVSKLHMANIFEHVEAANLLLNPWINRKTAFNLYMVYKSIPVRKDKEKVNAALHLLTAILEQRPIDKRIIFQHFQKLVRCYYYERYAAFSNISRESNRDFAFRKAVTNYWALITLLQQLELITGLNNKINVKMDAKQIAAEETIFLDTMNYDEEQKSLFFLGRTIHSLVREQTKRGHKKNALDKLNYNGMDAGAITRFSTELFESGRHYDITKIIEWPFAEFNRRFNPNEWHMNAQEALFFILSGYTYKIKRKEENEDSSDSNQ